MKQPTPVERLYAFIANEQPKSSCCGVTVCWWNGAGFGANWANAHYGTCTACGANVDCNGVNQNPGKVKPPYADQ